MSKPFDRLPSPGLGLVLWALLAATGCNDGALSRLAEDELPPRGDDDDGVTVPERPDDVCEPVATDPEFLGSGDHCTEETPGSLVPVVEWAFTPGGGCTSLPVVGDVDSDGVPEIAVNVTDLFGSAGSLHVLRGDGSGTLWSDGNASLGYAASPALADLEADGNVEIVAVREHASSMFLATGDYTVVAYDGATGAELWESEHFVGAQVGYSTSPAVVDLDNDGIVEIVAGRVILGPNGATRAVGPTVGSGAEGFLIPAVADLDLDGVDEVLGGDVWFRLDGSVIWSDPELGGGLVAVANLDGDPEGEVVSVVDDAVRAYQHDGTLKWGPVSPVPGQLVSAPAVGDLDGDGSPEIVVAAGSELHALDAGGALRWSVEVADATGSTGASIFDFSGDGRPEVVYIDEVQMVVLDGETGAVRFNTTEHASNTLWDYPVVADTDADGHAEVVVCHNGLGSPALSVFGAQDNSWMPARTVWNQHAYTIDNVADDLTIPTDTTPSFADTNTYHSAIGLADPPGVDVEARVVDVCDACDEGGVWVTAQVVNRGYTEVPAGIAVTLVARRESGPVPLLTVETPDPIEPGWTSEGLLLYAPAPHAEAALQLEVLVDDDGSGAGALTECSEANNRAVIDGPFCG